MCEQLYMSLDIVVGLFSATYGFITLLKFLIYIIFICSWLSDHYFRSVCVSVCLSVCLFVCAEFFSAVFDPISIKLGHMLYVWV